VRSALTPDCAEQFLPDTGIGLLEDESRGEVSC
jgi:hypothetical protein